MMKILRHNLAVRFTHWVTALATFVLLFTGFMQMPLAKRYNIEDIAGMSWTSDYQATVNIHYIAAIILVFISIYYITYLIGSKRWDIIPRRGDFKESLLIFASMVGLAKEPENDKYLAEQRLAFAVTAGSIFMIIISGFIKVYKNLPGVILSPDLIFWTTMVHNVFTVIILLSVIVHLLAFLLKDNRPLVVSMFTGKISYVYVQKRHKKWLKKLENKQKMKGKAV